MISIFQALRDIGVNVDSQEISFQINCPFHGSDKNPSARVYPETNSMYCFTCKCTYDPVGVYAAHFEITRGEAFSVLAKRYGIKSSSKHPNNKKSLDAVMADMLRSIKYVRRLDRVRALYLASSILTKVAKGESDIEMRDLVKDWQVKYFPRLVGRIG